MSIRATNQADVIPLRPLPTPAQTPYPSTSTNPNPNPNSNPTGALPREPLWRDLVGEVLRRERRAQGRTLKEVSEASRISMAYLSEVERGRKEASSEVLAAAAQALGLSLADVLALAGERLVSLAAVRSRSGSRSLGAAGRHRSVGPVGPAGPMGGVLLAA
ncbi:helix-turn-helix domain-containing protein [Streptomyces sp. NPDC091289]|uniref:helix-turn-helix domain-containing protein n=1 Tax=Streptomyces sp. NPDC091289 TaxID=3365989 RepID=UPI00382E562E